MSSARSTPTITTTSGMGAAAPFRLLQLSDSAFPRGSFAHSLGLESYVAEGAITRADALGEFIGSALRHSLAPLDGVYLREVHHAASGGRLEEIVSLDCGLSAAKPVRSLREASKSVGRQFLRTVRGYAQGGLLEGYDRAVARAESPGHHAVALGVAAEALEIGAREALLSLFYGAVSSFVSAGVRLIPLGQTEGQRVTAALEDAVAEAVEEAMTRRLEDAYSFGPGHEIRAMAQGRLYTRLFVS